MMKHTPGGYVGPNGGSDGHHGAVGGSSIHGIKTEMKYSGSAHALQNTHLQGQTHGHGHHVPQGHQPATHALPSIPHSMYTPGAVGTAGQGMHHSNVNTTMNRPAMGQMGSAPTHQPHYTPAAAHNMLSQSQQQQKLHPQSTMNPNVNIHHHPMPPNLHTQGPPANPVSSVPTGLLLSGPSSALLHSTSTTAGAVHTVTTLPSVASHTAVAAASVAPPPLSTVSTVSNNANLSMNSVPAPVTTVPGPSPAGANMFHKPT
jgi:hypothetical protein